MKVTITVDLTNLDTNQLAATLKILADRVRAQHVSEEDYVYDEYHAAVGTIAYS